MDKVIRSWRAAAEQRNVKAQSCLGIMYDSGQGVPQINKGAFEWHCKAADQGHTDAQFILVTMYCSGQEGVPKSHMKTLGRYCKAADQGYARAQRNPGPMYANGQGVVQSYNKALAWFRKAADQR